MVHFERLFAITDTVPRSPWGDGMPAYDYGTFSCRICGQVARTGADRPPSGWFRLYLCGSGRLSPDLPVVGYTCSQACLTVAVLRPYGLRDNEIRAWISDVAGSTR